MACSACQDSGHSALELKSGKKGPAVHACWAFGKGEMVAAL
uniref:Uncharacterized protein n=1 Tax=Arundo donax TaxID=35708 RepID=A0A0A9BEC5_ARUDO